MFFKHLLTLALAILSISTITACSLKISNPATPQAVIAVNPLSGGCLANSGAVLNSYFNGQISAADLDGFWACMDRAFRTFVNNTKGANDGYYTPDELRLFIDKYFMKAPVPEGFIEEAMVLKQSILGGRVDQVTSAELNHLLQVLQVFRTQTEAIRIYLPFSANTVQHKVLDPADFEQAVEAINTATEKIGDALSNSVGTYSFDHLDSFIDEMGILLYSANPPAGTGAWIADAKRYAKLLRDIKSILISPPADAIQTSDWQKIFYLVPRYFTFYMRVSYYIASGESMLEGSGLRKVNSMASDLHNLLSVSVKNHPAGYISYLELDSLLDKLENYGILPAPLESATLKPLLPVFFNKIFATNSPVINPDLGINVGTLDQVYSDFNNWSEGQFYLEGIFRSLAGDDNFMTKELGRYDLLTILPAQALQWTVQKNATSLVAIKDLQHDILSISTHFQVEQNIVPIPVGPPTQLYSFSHLTKLNMFRVLTELFIRGYAKDPKRITDHPSLTTDEVSALWADFFPVALQLKVLSPESKNVASSYVLEADLFTYAANGDGNFDLDEALEFESLIYSTATQGKLIHQAIANLCGGSTTIDPTCYRKSLVQNAGEYWNFIPGFAKAFNALSAADKTKMMQTFDKLAKRTDANAPYTSGDSQAYVLIPYFIEIVYSHFDMNQDGFIDEKEAAPAFPIFKGFLKGKIAVSPASFLTSDDDVRSVFMYMLHFGTSPEANLGEEARFAWWRYLDFNQWNCKTDRATIVQIFSVLLSMK